MLYDNSDAQIGYDEHPGNLLYIFIYDDSTTNGVTCLGNMQPAWPNPNGTYQGCEGPAADFGAGFDSYSWGQVWDKASQLQFYWNGTELGYYSDGSSPGINAQYLLSEIADSGGGQTMQQLLNDGLKYYSYYLGIYWWNGSAWSQFTVPFTAKQAYWDINGTFTDYYNPFCPTFGQSASDFNTNDYADMMENTNCASYGQSIG